MPSLPRAKVDGVGGGVSDLLSFSLKEKVVAERPDEGEECLAVANEKRQ